MKTLIKILLRYAGFEIKKYRPNIYEKRISLETKKKIRGHALLSYVLDPFLLKREQPISNAHTHDWESFQIAQTLLDLGYFVDVIDYRNTTFKPDKNYSFFLGARTNFERIAQQLNSNCLKIVHLDTSHWLFNNLAAYQRIFALFERRGVVVKNSKFLETNSAIEWADCATILGNRFTIDTYRYAKKPIYRVPISTCQVYPKPVEKDWVSCEKNFLWFGSSGLTHKGLDLVLEAFAAMPEYHLYVCGPISQEKDFEKAFYKELYQTPNIHTVGWVDVSSSQFIAILNQCIAVVYPSCAEGGGGSVINCLHAGLIPIVSYESSVDLNDFGILLRDCSIDEIKKAVIQLTGFPIERKRQMALKAWSFARKNHTREKFAEVFAQTISTILNN